MRVTSEALHVYAPDLRCVASHELRRKGEGQRVRLPNRQRPKATRRGPDLEQLRMTYDDIGESARSFLDGLQGSHPRSAAYHAKKILALRERYSTADLVGALKHALCYRAFDREAVERILAARAQPRRLDEHVSQEAARRLSARLGPDDTEPRALDEYDALPCLGGTTDERRREELPWPPSEADPVDPRPKTVCEPDCKGTSEPSDSSGSTTDGSTSC